MLELLLSSLGRLVFVGRMLGSGGESRLTAVAVDSVLQDVRVVMLCGSIEASPISSPSSVKSSVPGEAAKSSNSCASQDFHS